MPELPDHRVSAGHKPAGVLAMHVGVLQQRRAHVTGAVSTGPSVQQLRPHCVHCRHTPAIGRAIKWVQEPCVCVCVCMCVYVCMRCNTAVFSHDAACSIVCSSACLPCGTTEYQDESGQYQVRPTTPFSNARSNSTEPDMKIDTKMDTDTQTQTQTHTHLHTHAHTNMLTHQHSPSPL